MPIVFIIGLIAILFFSIVLHEIAHGYSAYSLGDPTAKYAGRLTLNPMSHISFVGTIVIPLLLYLTKAGFIFGWAKPVPYNPANLRGGRYGEAFVAAAGSLTNFAIVIIFSVFSLLLPDTFSEVAFTLVYYTIFINVLLGVFNLLPIPPLDGSKVILALFPERVAQWYRKNVIYAFDRLGFVGIFLLIFVLLFFILEPFFQLIFYLSNILYFGPAFTTLF